MRLAILLLFAAPTLTSLTPIDEVGFQKLVQSNKGKVVLYDFWATYCAPCRAETPELLKLEKKLHASGFVLVTISADEPESDARAAKMADQLGITRPAYRKEAKKTKISSTQSIRSGKARSRPCFSTIGTAAASGRL